MPQTREMLNMSDIEKMKFNISREMLNMLNMLDFLGEPRAVALTGVLPESLTCLTCLTFLGKC